MKIWTIELLDKASNHVLTATVNAKNESIARREAKRIARISAYTLLDIREYKTSFNKTQQQMLDEMLDDIEDDGVGDSST